MKLQSHCPSLGCEVVAGGSRLLTSYYLVCRYRARTQPRSFRFYSEAWRTTIAQRYGAQPEISFYDTAVIVENVDEKTASAA
jgi:hypothetical protein